MSLDYVWEVWQVIYALLQNLKNLDLDISEDEEFEHYKYMLQVLLPFLQRINEEQMVEKNLEAKRQGIFFYSVKWA